MAIEDRMPMPVFKFQLDSMRHTLMVALEKYHTNVEAMVDEATRKVVEEFDFEAFVRNEMPPIIEQQLRQELKNYFNHGPGNKAIMAWVREKVRGEEGADKR